MREYHPPTHLSYSSVTTYLECPRRWYIEKGLGIITKTWWASLAGTAGHAVCDGYDLREWGEDAPLGTFDDALEVEAEDAQRKGLVVSASGLSRRTKKIGKTSGPNGKDKEWWLHWGPTYVQGYRDWRIGTDWSIATLPNGMPGVEVPLDDVLMGGRPAKGFIDRIFVNSEGKLAICDLKFGNKPDNEKQLLNYGTMLDRIWGLRADYGFFYHAPSFGTLETWDLGSGEYDEPLDALYEMVWEGIENEEFQHNPSSRFCSPLCQDDDMIESTSAALAGAVQV